MEFTIIICHHCLGYCISGPCRWSQYCALFKLAWLTIPSFLTIYISLQLKCHPLYLLHCSVINGNILLQHCPLTSSLTRLREISFIFQLDSPGRHSYFFVSALEQREVIWMVILIEVLHSYVKDRSSGHMCYCIYRSVYYPFQWFLYITFQSFKLNNLKQNFSCLRRQCRINLNTVCTIEIVVVCSKFFKQTTTISIVEIKYVWCCSLYLSRKV